MVGNYKADVFIQWTIDNRRSLMPSSGRDARAPKDCLTVDYVRVYQIR